MFGTADMQIVGTKSDGSEVVFFKDGDRPAVLNINN